MTVSQSTSLTAAAFQRANSRTGCLSPHPTELRSRAERRTALWLPHPHERHAPIALAIQQCDIGNTLERQGKLGSKRAAVRRAGLAVGLSR